MVRARSCVTSLSRVSAGDGGAGDALSGLNVVRVQEEPHIEVDVGRAAPPTTAPYRSHRYAV
jgi:hypothetical protein